MQAKPRVALCVLFCSVEGLEIFQGGLRGGGRDVGAVVFPLCVLV